MPAPKDVPEGVYKNDQGRWIRGCPKCGEIVSHSRRNYCIGAYLIKQPCKRCSNINNNPSGRIGEVRMAWYGTFKKSAITRGYSWNLTPQEVSQLYEKQGRKCALSGLPIGWSVTGWNHSASIDRMDNDGGYCIDNIQLVHKKINMMRGSLAIDDFVSLCIAVADKVKW